MTEPWPLRTAERRMIHAVNEAADLLRSWTRETTTARWRARHKTARDEALAHLRQVQASVADGTFVFQEADEFSRPGKTLNLGACRAQIAQTLEELQATSIEPFEEAGEDQKPQLYDQVLNSQIVTHILAGRIQDPDNQGDTPLVYARITKGNELVFKCWKGFLSQGQVELFSVKAIDALRVAAVLRHNECEGARYAIFQGLIKPIEAKLLDKCAISSRRALDVSRALGFSGEATFAERDLFIADRAARRARILPKLTEFLRVASNGDQRLNEVMVSRAAASLHQWRESVPNLADEMVSPYIFDYCIEFGSTRDWDIEIIPHGDERMPRNFPQNYDMDDHEGPFNGIAMGALSLRVADLEDLKSITLIASHALEAPSVAPGDSVERIAKTFYGNFVDGDNFDLVNPPETTYFGMPIWTNRWEAAMREVYAGVGRPPPIPRVFTTSPPPYFPANDAARNALRMTYRECYSMVKDGGLKAFNAITQQTMARLYQMLLAPQCDILEGGRIGHLLLNWLADEDDDGMLAVTRENSNMAESELCAIVAAQRRDDRPEGERRGLNLLPRDETLARVDFTKRVMVRRKVSINVRGGGQ